MQFIISMLSITILLFSLSSCGNDSDSSGIQKNITKDVTVSGRPFVESLGIAQHVHANVSLGAEPKDVYMLLSNYDKNDVTVQIGKSLKRGNKMTYDTFSSVTSNKMRHLESTIVHAPAEVELFRKNLKSYLDYKVASIDNTSNTKKLQKDVQGDSKRFYLDTYGRKATMATARKVVSISTTHGAKQLNIWVSDDSFGKGCARVKCISQAMVDALANTFLKEGLDNDVYDWVSNVFGAEWGTHSKSNTISNNNEITILLTDIENDNRTNGGILGFFYQKDNFKKDVIPGSNERIMLYADSVLFANGTGSWSIHDFWPKEMVSTLAHELQHMIHFYQKSILRTDDTTDTWINEMLSESTEDLVASKIGHTGSRGVNYRIGSAGEPGNTLGRYPIFNAKNNISLTKWYGGSENYSAVNAFGAFLLRNYGGAKVLHDVVHNNLIDEKAIVHAVQQTPKGQGKTFDDLLREWGVAVLLSDNEHLGENFPHYNTGGYMPNQYNLSTYALGSVNFFNYNPKPQFYGNIGTVQAQGNYYYKVGRGLTGDINIDLTLNGKIEATLIVK